METIPWDEAVAGAFQDLWLGLVQFIPALVVALLVLLVGWAIGTVVAGAVRSLARSLNADKAADYVGLDDVAKRGGFRLDIPAFFGWIVKWFFIIVFLVASLEILGLPQVTNFLEAVAFSFLPDLIVATLILVFGAVIANVAENFITRVAKSANVSSAGFLGNMARWAIWVFAGLAALYQIGIATALVQMLFGGFVFALALALGLSFGLGGREHASQFLSKLRSNINK